MTIEHPSFGPLADGRVIIFDTTLRDGEQSPGFSMNLEEKLRMAEALAELDEVLRLDPGCEWAKRYKRRIDKSKKLLF